MIGLNKGCSQAVVLQAYLLKTTKLVGYSASTLLVGVQIIINLTFL